MDVSPYIDKAFYYSIYGVLGGLTYTMGFRIINNLFATTLFRKKIESMEELEKIVDVEARKLGLNPSSIDVEYATPGNGEVRKIGDKYKIWMEKGRFNTPQIVQHELYHIKRGDCDKYAGRQGSFFASVFIIEPRAILYGCFGIKL